MLKTTVLAIILAAVAALLLVFFQYYHKSKLKGKLRLWLSFFRFLTIFCTFLLLVNPKFVKKRLFLEKSNLIVLVDNSSSVKNTSGMDQVEATLKELKESEGLADKFNLTYYMFGKEPRLLDTLDYNDNATDITKGIKTLHTIYGHSESAVILLSDGNATLGEDYEYYGVKQKFPVFPVVLGDTTQYEDVKVVQVNSNRYAFLKNKFPVEIFVSYDGDREMDSRLRITMDGEAVHSRELTLSSSKNTESLTVLLNADSVGPKTIQVRLDPLENEKNVVNNNKNIVVEVIDEKTNVTIVSEILHPDIGALKKSIESNEQRSVTIVKPSIDTKKLNDSDILILYQPTSSFRAVYDYISKTNIAIFTITGPKTNWNFLNRVQNAYSKNSYGQSEDIFPLVNKSFVKFSVPDLSFENYPPLETYLGETMIIKNHEVLLTQKIKGNDIGEPLLAVLDDGKSREALLFGENLWKWRVQDYRDHQNFNDFDELMGKLILYLSMNETKNRLILNYEPFYDYSTSAKISANYFDESFTFDPNARITLKLTYKEDGTTQEYPMLLKGGYYEADLSNMPSGEYAFTVTVIDGNLTKSGSFSILDFDLEQQFTSSDHHKLIRLANGTGGKSFYPSQTKALIDDLLGDDKFNPIQKSDQNVVSLVDFRFILAILIAALAAEWFIRKYNGLT